MQLLLLTAGAALTVLTAQAATILNADYTAAQGYVNGDLHGQLNWSWAATDDVQVNINGSGSVTSGGWGRSGYILKGARSGTSATGGFNAGDVLKITFDYQFSLPGTVTIECARVGVRGSYDNTGGPTNGLHLTYNPYQGSTGGSLRFFPNMADIYGSSSYALILSGTNFGLDAANYFGNGVKTNSDPMRIYYQMTCLGAGVWQASLAVSNKVSGRSWSYSGSTRYITNSLTDAFYCQQLAWNDNADFRGVSDGVVFEYAPAVLLLTSGNYQSANVGTALANPFVVTVRDAGGNPFAGTNVTFTVTATPSGATGQSLSVTNVATDANGQASSTLALGNRAGTYVVTAACGSLSGSPVTFMAMTTTTQAVVAVAVDFTQRRYIGGITTFDRETWFGTYLEAGYGNTEVNIGGTNKTVDQWILSLGNMLPARVTQGYSSYWNGSGYTPYSQDPARPGYILPVELTNHAVPTERYVTGKTLNPGHKTILAGQGPQWPSFMCWPTNLTHGVNTVSNLAGYAEAVTIAYANLYNANGLIPQWYEVCNESDSQSNFGWHWDANAWTNNAKFHSAVADAMAVAWPQIKVAGPADGWPFREGPNGSFGDWLKANKQFIQLSGNRLGAYSFHAYEYDFAARLGSNTVYEAQFGSPIVWSKGRLECFVDLWENEHLLTWGTRKPFIMSEYGILSWSNTNYFNYAKSCNAMLVAMLDRPDLMDKMSVYILSYAPWDPDHRVTLFTSDNGGASYYPTKFINYLSFWNDLNGDYLFSTSSSYHLLSRAFLTNNTAYVVLHNNHRSGLTVNLQPNVPAGATVLNARMKMMFQNGIDLGYSEYATLTSLTNVPVPAEATAIVCLTLGGLGTLPVVDEDNYYGNRTLVNIGAGVDETFTINVAKQAYQSITGARLYASLFKTNGFAVNPAVIRVNGQSLTNVPDITHSFGVSSSWKQLVVEVPAAALVGGTNLVSLRFPQAGGKITSVRLAVDSSITLNIQAHQLPSAPGGAVLQIQVPTIVGHNYSVYRTPLLQPATWNSITNFPGTGGTMLINDPIGGNTHFYRVQVSP